MQVEQRLALAWAEAIWGLGESIIGLGLSGALLPRGLGHGPRMVLRLIVLIAYGNFRLSKIWKSPLKALACDKLPKVSPELMCATFAHLLCLLLASRLTLPSLDIVFAAIVEEVIFRGVVFRLLLRRCPEHLLGCIFTQAFLFAFFHLSNLSRRSMSFVMTQLASALVCGSAFAALAYRDTLYDTIFLHSVNNLVATAAFSDWTEIQHRSLITFAGLLVYATIFYFVYKVPYHKRIMMATNEATGATTALGD